MAYSPEEVGAFLRDNDLGHRTVDIMADEKLLEIAVRAVSFWEATSILSASCMMENRVLPVLSNEDLLVLQMHFRKL